MWQDKDHTSTDGFIFQLVNTLLYRHSLWQTDPVTVKKNDPQKVILLEKIKVIDT